MKNMADIPDNTNVSTLINYTTITNEHKMTNDQLNAQHLSKLYLTFGEIAVPKWLKITNLTRRFNTKA